VAAGPLLLRCGAVVRGSWLGRFRSSYRGAVGSWWRGDASNRRSRGGAALPWCCWSSFPPFFVWLESWLDDGDSRAVDWSGPSLTVAGGVWQCWWRKEVGSGQWWSLEGVRRSDLVAQRSDVMSGGLPWRSGGCAEGVGILGRSRFAPFPLLVPVTAVKAAGAHCGVWVLERGGVA
jgi:hypothetical protein